MTKHQLSHEQAAEKEARFLESWIVTRGILEFSSSEVSVRLKGVPVEVRHDALRLLAARGRIHPTARSASSSSPGGVVRWRTCSPIGEREARAEILLTWATGWARDPLSLNAEEIRGLYLWLQHHKPELLTFAIEPHEKRIDYISTWIRRFVDEKRAKREGAK